MFRAQPVVNKILFKKWEEKGQLLHETKVREARSALDSRVQGKRFKHLQLKLKKGQQQEGNLKIISYREVHRD